MRFQAPIDISLGVVWPVIISIFATYNIILSSGFTFYGDFAVTPNISDYLRSLGYSWIQLSSTPNHPEGFLYVVGFALPYFIGASAALAPKIFISTSYAALGIFSYASLRMFTMKQFRTPYSMLGGVASASVAMVNMYSITSLQLPHVLLALGLLPFAFVIYTRLINAEISLRRGSVILAISVSAMMIFSAMVFLFIGIGLLYLLYSSLRSPNKLQFLTRGIERSVLGALLWIPLNAYAIGSWLNQLLLRPSFYSAYYPESFAIDTFSSQRGYGVGFDPLRVLSLNIGSGAFLPISSTTITLGLVVPLLSALCLLQLSKLGALKKDVSFFAIVTALGVLFTIRTPPFGYLSEIIAQRFFSSGLLWAFIRNPNNLIPVVILGYSVLFGISLAVTADRLSSRRRK
jgi:hypothetical protein